MNRPRTLHVLAAGAALSFLAVPLAGPAFAQTDTTRVPRASVDLDGVRTRCLAAVDRRFTTLDELDAKVTAAKHLSDGEESDLRATIGATRTGLTGLRAEIEGDTDAASMREDCKAIVDDYRVYVLVAPQVRLLTGADSAQTAVDALDGTVIPKLQSAIDAAAAAGTDVTEATQLLDEVKASTTEADSLSDGVLSSVSPLTPADYNAGTAAPVLHDARTDLATVARDLKSARADIDQIRTLLG
jgi:hypothetical protein